MANIREGSGGPKQKHNEKTRGQTTAADSKKGDGSGKKDIVTKEISLDRRRAQLQRTLEPLITRSKAVVARVHNIEDALQSGEQYLAIHIEACVQQVQKIETLRRRIERNKSTAGKAAQAQDAPKLSTTLETLEKDCVLLEKEVEELEKILDTSFSQIQNPVEKVLGEERKKLDEKIKELILKITHLKEELGNIGERVTRRRTLSRERLYDLLKQDILELEERIQPLTELTAYSSDDAAIHDLDRLRDDDRNRSAFLQETQTLFEEARQLYTELEESLQQSKEIVAQATPTKQKTQKPASTEKQKEKRNSFKEFLEKITKLLGLQ